MMTLPKRRGRPPGATAQVVRDPRSLGVHHFAFVRASLYGVDLREAFLRYLAWSETTTDLRYIQNRRDALLKNIIEAGRHLDATLAIDAKITHLLDLLRSDAPVPSAVTLPTLEEWVESEGMSANALLCDDPPLLQQNRVIKVTPKSTLRLVLKNATIFMRRLSFGMR